jgi:ribose 5-phosphate isomerase A
MNELKIKVAKAALDYIEQDSVVGVGTGSTVNFFIKELATIKHKIEGCVCSSKATEALIRAVGIPIIELNSVQELPIYIDGADEVTLEGRMIKGGGGAHTGEKIVAHITNQFVCIVDESKIVSRLGAFPVAVEVIPMARSMVARELVRLGGDPEYREGFVTDNGNFILDVFHFSMDNVEELEKQINLIPGVVDNGLFTHKLADIILVASQDEVKRLK